MIDTDGVKDRIGQLRDDHGMNSTQFARALGVHIRTARSWLHGERVPSMDMMCLIADTFDVSLDWLYRGVKHGV